MKSKSAQTEIVGLLIIVILITIGMLFYLSYVTVQGDESTKSNVRKEFVDNELSMSFVQTFVRTTIPECNDLSVDTLVRDCGLGELRINCGGLTSCEQLEATLDEIRTDTLDVWDRSYALQITFGPTSPSETIVFDQYDCLPGTIGRRAPGVQRIPYFPDDGTALIELAICKK